MENFTQLLITKQAHELCIYLCITFPVIFLTWIVANSLGVHFPVTFIPLIVNLKLMIKTEPVTQESEDRCCGSLVTCYLYCFRKVTCLYLSFLAYEVGLLWDQMR